jgi:outer membrane scaffolding protein for murein synthesis (MipA/OmpV family)
MTFLMSSILFAQPTENLELARRAATAEPPEGQSASNLKVSVGAGIMTAPEFEGAKKNELKALPVVELSYDRVFFSLSKGLGVRIIDNEAWTISPSLRYWAGRDEDASDRLRGLGDVDAALALGGMISYHPGDLSLFLNGYHGLGSEEGFTVELGAALSRQLMEKLNFTAELSTLFADEDYNQKFFGVTRQQAARSGYDFYQADAGFKHVALGGTLSYNLTQSINLGLFGEYKRLTGPAADSPIVERGSKNQVSSGLMIGFNLK